MRSPSESYSLISGQISEDTSIKQESGNFCSIGQASDSKLGNLTRRQRAALQKRLNMMKLVLYFKLSYDAVISILPVIWMNLFACYTLRKLFCLYFALRALDRIEWWLSEKCCETVQWTLDIHVISGIRKLGATVLKIAEFLKNCWFKYHFSFGCIFIFFIVDFADGKRTQNWWSRLNFSVKGLSLGSSELKCMMQNQQQFPQKLANQRLMIFGVICFLECQRHYLLCRLLVL